ncbi:MAG: hypothetical protein EPN21_07870 [Methylococcaceae bacterium]|nr:MAG: hypothetical protein EPN21_07870 [Methylococcaceae bacterium]
MTLSVLDAMAAQSKSGHVPSLLQAMAIDAITGEWALLQFYADAAGAKVIFADDIVALEMGRLALAQEQLRKEVKKRSDGLKRIAGRV